MQACLSFPPEEGELDEHLIMKGAAIAVAAAVCMNFLRDGE
jgi:hypothetical protein